MQKADEQKIKYKKTNNNNKEKDGVREGGNRKGMLRVNLLYWDGESKQPTLLRSSHDLFHGLPPQPANCTTSNHIPPGRPQGLASFKPLDYVKKQLRWQIRPTALLNQWCRRRWRTFGGYMWSSTAMHTFPIGTPPWLIFRIIFHFSKLAKYTLKRHFHKTNCSPLDVFLLKCRKRQFVSNPLCL